MATVHRGLMVQEKWANLFLSGKKTMEVRTFHCRVVQPQSVVYLIACGQGWVFTVLLVIQPKLFAVFVDLVTLLHCYTCVLLLEQIPQTGKAADGKACLKVVGKLRFEGNQQISDSDFSKYHTQHQVSQADFANFTGTWKNYKGFVVGWQFSLVEAFATPMWIPHKQDKLPY